MKYLSLIIILSLYLNGFSKDQYTNVVDKEFDEISKILQKKISPISLNLNKKSTYQIRFRSKNNLLIFYIEKTKTNFIKVINFTANKNKIKYLTGEIKGKLTEELYKKCVVLNKEVIKQNTKRDMEHLYSGKDGYVMTFIFDKEYCSTWSPSMLYMDKIELESKKLINLVTLQLLCNQVYSCNLLNFSEFRPLGLELNSDQSISENMKILENFRKEKWPPSQ